MIFACCVVTVFDEDEIHSFLKNISLRLKAMPGCAVLVMSRVTSDDAPYQKLLANQQIQKKQFKSGMGVSYTVVGKNVYFKPGEEMPIGSISQTCFHRDSEDALFRKHGLKVEKKTIITLKLLIPLQESLFALRLTKITMGWSPGNKSFGNHSLSLVG